jgi:predicted metal-dependent peptidase
VPARRKTKAPAEDPATQAFWAGCEVVWQHPMLAPLWAHTEIVRDQRSRCPADGWAVVTSNGLIHVHPKRRAEPAEWTYVIAHCLLHLGLGHVQERQRPAEWNAACDAFVHRFLSDFKLGTPPPELRGSVPFNARSEEALYDQLCEGGIPIELSRLSTAGRRTLDMAYVSTSERHSPWPGRVSHYSYDYQTALGEGLVAAVTSAVNVAGGIEPRLGSYHTSLSRGQQAQRWFINHYPLLGALAAGFTIVEDPSICRRLGISIAAVYPADREIYLNPGAGLDQEECRFVMAHEMLHAALMHGSRAHGREPFLWNVACDYVVNGWLVEMGVGELPQIGVLYDEQLKRESAESIYDRMAVDMRRYRKLATLRGAGLGDILGDLTDEGTATALDDFYRRALSQGLIYHEEQGRGFLPAALVEEIRALMQPPVPWDVELARWFDQHFPPLELERTYARPSRRQASTPDIPRPRWVANEEQRRSRTYGVVLDTSGSMGHQLLAKALGTIASYSIARDVPSVRVVFCDAAAYDQGYVPPEDIAGRVKIKGRGGTVLQPAVDLLEKAPDFPPTGPILIITDGWTDRLHVHRDHAFVIPVANKLPFVPRGPVFWIS